MCIGDAKAGKRRLHDVHLLIALIAAVVYSTLVAPLLPGTLALLRCCTHSQHHNHQQQQQQQHHGVQLSARLAAPLLRLLGCVVEVLALELGQQGLEHLLNSLVEVYSSGGGWCYLEVLLLGTGWLDAAACCVVWFAWVGDGGGRAGWQRLIGGGWGARLPLPATSVEVAISVFGKENRKVRLQTGLMSSYLQLARIFPWHTPQCDPPSGPKRLTLP